MLVIYWPICWPASIACIQSALYVDAQVINLRKYHELSDGSGIFARREYYVLIVMRTHCA